MDLAAFLGGILLCVAFGVMLIFLSAFVFVFLYYALKSIVAFLFAKRRQTEPAK